MRLNLFLSFICHLKSLAQCVLIRTIATFYEDEISHIFNRAKHKSNPRMP